jgi:hypothetical protein
MAIKSSRSALQIEADSKAIEAAIQAAVRDTLLEHKRLGQPIVVSDENDNVVWVPAEEIEIPDL